MLLRLAHVCHKLETKKEKVLPFYTSSLNAEELSQEKAHAMEVMSEELAQVKYNYFILQITFIGYSFIPHSTHYHHTITDVQNKANMLI